MNFNLLVIIEIFNIVMSVFFSEGLGLITNLGERSKEKEILPFIFIILVTKPHDNGKF